MHCHFKRISLSIYHFILMAVAAWVCFSGCATFEAVTHAFTSTDHFTAYPKDQRVLYEPGAEVFAEAVAKRLPAAVEKIKTRQYAPFAGDITIYVCESRDSFKKMTGRPVAAMAYRKSIFLSPILMERPDSLELYIAHELSHLHLGQHIGGWAYLHIPAWFTEGLAAYVSDGGGTEKVTDDEAFAAIKSGNHFKPVDRAGLGHLFVPKNASYWGIDHAFKHHMFYRQCMLFVAFLANENPGQFKRFLFELESGKAFSQSFHTSFETDTMIKWAIFKNQIVAETTTKGVYQPEARPMVSP